MQVKCPQCEKIGLLQTITPRYHRVRHNVYVYHTSASGKQHKVREFGYCRVGTDWALDQIKAEKEKEEADYRKILGIK